MSKNCVTPEPAKGKSKGNGKGTKGSSKGKAAGGKGRNGKNSKGEFFGFCSFCGKSGHKEADCWAKERRPSSAPLANVDAAAVDKELGGFDVAGLDFSLVPPAPKPHKTWADICSKEGTIYISNHCSTTQRRDAFEPISGDSQSYCNSL